MKLHKFWKAVVFALFLCGWLATALVLALAAAMAAMRIFR
jgi:hypothetical protein